MQPPHFELPTSFPHLGWLCELLYYNTHTAIKKCGSIEFCRVKQGNGSLMIFSEICLLWCVVVFGRDILSAAMLCFGRLFNSTSSMDHHPHQQGEGLLFCGGTHYFITIKNETKSNPSWP